MLKKYNIAMLGAGKIAFKISSAIDVCEDRIVRYGVASRDKSHAEAFAKSNGFQKVYNDYEELIRDTEIDFVYISTPTQMHYEHMKMCLLAGKNVICEKPFALNYAEVKELIILAEEKGLICMDAMWSMYMPMWQEISSLIENKEIGKIKLLTASFGYPSIHIPRLLDKNGGGSFYDLGVYCVTVAKRVLGNEYKIIKAEFEKYQDVDIVNKIKLQMGECKVRLHSSIKRRDSYLFSAWGSKGMILSRKFWLGRGFYIWKYPFSLKKYSYIHKRHDVFEYSKEFNIEHRYHKTIADNIKSEFLSKIKYIVNIGTWSSAIVCNQFIQVNPNIVVIHIQNSILPNQYKLDKYENLSRYNTNISQNITILNPFLRAIMLYLLLNALIPLPK